MEISTFIGVGENIHCTRIYKVGGKFVRETGDGAYAVHYEAADGSACQLPVPQEFMQRADWAAGKTKHCAVAIWQGNYGDDAGKQAGAHYIRSLAKREEDAGAAYLDINVDEFSTDVKERVKLIKWTVETAQEVTSIPMSIDSSNTDILKAGLEACDQSRGRPMVNSVSLERTEAISVAAEFSAVVIASAAGERDLPNSTEERLANLDRLMPLLEAAGLKKCDIHVDPLVFPISVDGENGKRFLEATAAVREKYGPEIHLVAGLSNISFGMPKRDLINRVFTLMAVEAGADGGIVDPFRINVGVLNSMDTGSEAFVLARDLLLGKDEYGMNFITASREGNL